MIETDLQRSLWSEAEKLPLVIIISKIVLFNGWRELRLLAFRFDLFEFIGARRKLSLQDASIKISRVVFDDVASWTRRDLAR